MTQKSIYAIGDIHGQHEMLQEALQRIEADGGPDATIVFLGDLVDRGPDSCGVINTLIAGQTAGKPWIVVKGNHDQMFQDFLEHGALSSPQILSGRSWLHPRLGGPATLKSYGVIADEVTPNLQLAREAVPTSHRQFLENLPLYHQTGPYLFVHAGIDPSLPLERQTQEHLIWIRDPFLNHRAPFPWLVVHGHTAKETPEHQGNRVNLDSGAGWGRALTAGVFEDEKCWVLGSEGRQALLPVENA